MKRKTGRDEANSSFQMPWDPQYLGPSSPHSQAGRWRKLSSQLCVISGPGEVSSRLHHPSSVTTPQSFFLPKPQGGRFHPNHQARRNRPPPLPLKSQGGRQLSSTCSTRPSGLGHLQGLQPQTPTGSQHIPWLQGTPALAHSIPMLTNGEGSCRGPAREVPASLQTSLPPCASVLPSQGGT